jgi:hypothetical protein
MTDKDITQLFKKLKDDSDTNRAFDADRSWKLISERCGFDSEQKESNYGFRDHVEYYVWQITHATAKPLIASLAVFVFMFSGWVGATNASFSALPGDKMYQVKLTMEKVQLNLTGDQMKRSKLQVEFATRRLDEMVELAALTPQDMSSNRVQLAVNNFKTEVAHIKEDLSKDNPENTKALAKVVGRKAEIYRTTVSASNNSFTDNVKSQVEEIGEIIDEAEEQAVEVFITAHEELPDEESANELKHSFEKQFGALTTKELSESQIEKIDLARLLADEGAYRRAFQLLKEVQLDLKQLDIKE